MAGIILPGRLKSQPQYNLPIDRGGLGKGIQILFNPALGPVDLATGRVWASGGGTNVAIGDKGKSFAYASAGDYHGYTGYPELTSNVGTFFMWCPIVGAPDTNGHVYFGASSPAVSGHQINQNGSIIIGTGSGGSSGTLSSWFNTANRSLVLVSDGTAAGCKAFVDGVDTGFTWNFAPTAWGAGSKNFNLGRYVGASGFQFYGSMLCVGNTGAVWRAAEAKAFHDSKGFALYKAPARRLWVVANSVVNLAGANSPQANTASTGTISQIHVLIEANSSQVSAASAAAILQNHVLADAKSAQANSDNGAGITQTHVITGTNSSQANAGNTGAISGGSGLMVVPGDQANASSSGTVTQAHALVIIASAQASSSAAIAITQVHIPAGANLAQSNSSSAVAISLSTGNLLAAPLIQINLSGAGAISQSGTVFDQGPSSLAVSTAFKKPGIPAGTPAWLKIFLEIIAGRRGNKIAVPLRQNLTFSATPTKAECEALYSYVNDMRASLDALVNRLDS